MTQENPFDLTGKVALVTGGNSGIGLGFARAVATAGADVVIWSRRAAKNEEAAEELRSYGGRVHAQAIDVTQENAVVRGMEEAVEVMGRVDCAFANAGIATLASAFHEMSVQMYDELIAVSQHGGFFTVREACKHMVNRCEAGDPGGSIVTCGSLMVTHGVPLLQHYAAAKGAMAALTKSVAVEYGPYGIRANMILPGYILTHPAADLSDSGLELNEEQRTRFGSVELRTPMRRWGTPQDIGGLAVYLMSDASSFHTADLIHIDGGISAYI
jgi:NAD(P)-dependent dehydrogenase (short-subunit alcohol dehydrogenase family)